jgi:hypothetical protein
MTSVNTINNSSNLINLIIKLFAFSKNPELTSLPPETSVLNSLFVIPPFLSQSQTVTFVFEIRLGSEIRNVTFAINVNATNKELLEIAIGDAGRDAFQFNTLSTTQYEYLSNSLQSATENYASINALRSALNGMLVGAFPNLPASTRFKILTALEINAIDESRSYSIIIQFIIGSDESQSISKVLSFNVKPKAVDLINAFKTE